MISIVIKKSRLFLIIFITFLLLHLTGCATTPIGPKTNGTTREGNTSSLQESAILFGFISKVNTGFSNKDLPVDKIEFVQINPDIAPMFITPGNHKNDWSMNYTHPVPVGAVFKIASWDDKIGMIDYGHDDDIGGGKAGGAFTALYSRIYPPFDQSLIITVSKSGLCYYGSYLLDKDRENFTIDKKKTELDALKLLAKKYKNTSWENMIMERIKELEK